eukprot:14522105-Ditylum_brightwellii.AAC.1
MEESLPRCNNNQGQCAAEAKLLIHHIALIEEYFKVNFHEVCDKVTQNVIEGHWPMPLLQGPVALLRLF